MITPVAPKCPKDIVPRAKLPPNLCVISSEANSNDVLLNSDNIRTIAVVA